MGVIKSEIVEVEKSDQEIFNFIGDFNNFAQLMPPQVKDVNITTDSCSFSIQGMPTVSLMITERIPYESVTMQAQEGKLPFSLKCTLQPIDSTNCKAQFHFDAELNMMMKMMVEKPLTNFLNLLAQKLKEIKS